jgi:hypothetical protein
MGMNLAIKVTYKLVGHSKRATHVAPKLIMSMAKMWSYMPVISTTTKVAVKGA